MDDLQFRRTIYANPNCADEDVKQAAEKDSAKQKFWREVKELDAAIVKASNIRVPENLAEKLILKQSIQSQKIQRRKTRIHLATAASIAFIVGLSFSLFQQPAKIDLGEHAIAHVTQEANGYALNVNGDFSLENVNFQLANLGAEFTQDIGRIYYANFCNFQNIRSFHMVLESENGDKVTVFVVPHSNDMRTVRSFTGSNLAGKMFKSQQTDIIIVGEQVNSVDKVKDKLQKNMQFSA